MGGARIGAVTRIAAIWIAGGDRAGLSDEKLGAGGKAIVRAAPCDARPSISQLMHVLSSAYSPLSWA